MTRIRYRKPFGNDSEFYTSQIFQAGSSVVEAYIEISNENNLVIVQDLDVYENRKLAYSKDLKSAKKLARKLLIEAGVVFEKDIRKRKV
jgi:hypothetical protein